MDAMTTPGLETIAASLRARAENSRLRAVILQEMADQMTRQAQALDRHADDILTAIPPASIDVVIAREGVPTQDGRLLLPGSLTWEDGPLPLTYLPEGDRNEGHVGNELIGTVTNLSRVNDDIWGTLHYPGWMNLTGGPAIECSDVEYNPSDDETLVTRSASLRAVCIVPSPSWGLSLAGQRQ